MTYSMRPGPPGRQLAQRGLSVPIVEIAKDLFEKWNPDFERCGVLSSRGTIIEVPNAALENEGLVAEFAMTGVDVSRAVGSSVNVAGIWHTHPSNSVNLSKLDLLGRPPGLRYFIVAECEIVEWMFDDSDGEHWVTARASRPALAD